MTNDDTIIPLSRWRASLARARRQKRAEAILAEPDVEHLVPRLPVQELYYAIMEVGLADAHDLVALASPEQVQGFLDLDVWQKDEIDEQKMEPWIELLVEAGPEKLAHTLERLDAEVVALYVARHARVYDLELDLAPDEPEGHYFPTPDRAFLLDIQADGERGKSFERVIDYLYRADMKLARHSLMTARSEMASHLEEEARRWRAGRMADLGYADYYDALGVYKWLDPATVKLDEANAQHEISTPLPTALLPSLVEGFFTRALGTLSDDLESVEGRLMTLTNRVMAADLVEPGDLEGARAALERTAATLGLGLEYLTRGKLENARAILEGTALERIFRVGFSLTLQLKNLAATLMEKGRVDGHLDPPFDAIIAALQQTRPLFADQDGKARPFRTLADVARTAALLEEAAEAPRAVWDLLQLSPDQIPRDVANLPGEIRFGTLVRTLAARVVLDGKPSLQPLGPVEIAQLARIDDAEAQARAKLPPGIPERWLSRWLPGLATAPSRPGGTLVRLVR